MHVVVVEWLSLKETGADKQGNQLTAEEKHDCCSLHEILLQNELKMAVGSLLLNLVEKKLNKWARDRKQLDEEEEGKRIEMRRRRRQNNRNKEEEEGKQ